MRVDEEQTGYKRENDGVVFAEAAPTLGLMQERGVGDAQPWSGAKARSW